MAKSLVDQYNSAVDSLTGSVTLEDKVAHQERVLDYVGAFMQLALNGFMSRSELCKLLGLEEKA